MYAYKFADAVPTLDELMILKYTDEGMKKKIRIISQASHQWKDIASLICSDTNKTSTLEKQYQNDPNECLRQVLIHNFINKKPLKYSQSWSGLVELLDDIDLETVSKELEHALSCIEKSTT